MNSLYFCPSETRMLLFEQVPTLLERSVPPPSLPFTWSYRESSEHPDTYVGAATGEFPKHPLTVQHKPSLSGSSLGEFIRLLSSACIPSTCCSLVPAPLKEQRDAVWVCGGWAAEPLRSPRSHSGARLPQSGGSVLPTPTLHAPLPPPEGGCVWSLFFF